MSFLLFGCAVPLKVSSMRAYNNRLACHIWPRRASRSRSNKQDSVTFEESFILLTKSLFFPLSLDSRLTEILFYIPMRCTASSECTDEDVFIVPLLWHPTVLIL